MRQKEERAMMTDETFDKFLDNATHRVADLWEEVSGKTLALEEKYRLNDVLTAFFSSKRKVRARQRPKI
jgi:hypothetical protein